MNANGMLHKDQPPRMGQLVNLRAKVLADEVAKWPEVTPRITSRGHILYFFGTSPADEVRLHHRELLLHEYHASLTSTMAKLGCRTELPEFDKLHKILKERGLREIIAAVTVLPFVVFKKDVDVPDDDEYSSYRGKSYRKIMSRLLPLYDSMGLLDV